MFQHKSGILTYSQSEGGGNLGGGLLDNVLVAENCGGLRDGFSSVVRVPAILTTA